jgi:LPS export ABC transporter permease LptF
VGLLSRAIFREISSSALLGAALFVFVLVLQRAAQLFSILVSTSATAGTVATIFLLLLPATMPLTLPLGVLVGILITLSRMSGDGEITAMRAAGIPAWRLLVPVLSFALLAAAATGFCSLYLTPWSNAQLIRTVNQLGAAQLSSEIQPRVFEEGFPNKVLYIGDLIPGEPVVWRNVFIADLTPGSERRTMGPPRGDWPVVTIAAEAVVVPDPARNRLQLSLRNGATYEPAADPAEYHRITFPRGEQVLEARPRAEMKAKYYTATPTLELLPELPRNIEARIEFHQRFALPMACLLLGLAAFPLGVGSRRGGRSGAFVITVAFALFYYTALVSLIGLAREGRIAPELAAWLPVKGWSEFFPGAVVMVTQNDYARELFNGDTGLILPAREGGLFGVFPRPGTLLRVPVDELPGPELAFAVTVHKSQGSEYDEVLLILPPPQSEAAGRLLTREVLYTAVTRAKRRVTILADARTLFTACSRGAIRAG